MHHLEVVRPVLKDCGATQLFKKYLLCPVYWDLPRRREEKEIFWIHCDTSLIGSGRGMKLKREGRDKES